MARFRTLEEIEEAEAKWHKKFAFWPTRMTSDKNIVIWFESYLRKRVDRVGDDSDWLRVESSFDILRNPSGRS